MTDQEAAETYDDMVQMFSDLPSPEHEPIRFAFYVKMYKYIKQRQEVSNENQK